MVFQAGIRNLALYFAASFREAPSSLGDVLRWLMFAWVPLTDWISDALAQEYTNLQSLVKRLDHRGIAPDVARVH